MSNRGNTFNHQDRSYSFARYPITENQSLRAWSAADEWIVTYLNEQIPAPGPTAIVHDRFGFLSCLFHAIDPLHILSYKSQERAIWHNRLSNKISVSDLRSSHPHEPITSGLSLALMKIPKSLALFQYYLHQLSQSLSPDSKVVCGFMTRHFTPQLIKISEKYFESVEQSLAKKKARLLILGQPRPLPDFEPLSTVTMPDGTTLQQYPGVFSAAKPDPASLFFLEKMTVPQGNVSVLDVGCGNGILSKYIRNQNPEAILHMTDDFVLAVESAKLNVQEDPSAQVHYTDQLMMFEDASMDWAVSNPPYHFEHETNIEIALNLFREVHRCLKPEGHFQLVSSKHLNLKTHLVQSFQKVSIVGETTKMVVYDCVK